MTKPRYVLLESITRFEILILILKILCPDPTFTTKKQNGDLWRVFIYVVAFVFFLIGKDLI